MIYVFSATIIYTFIKQRDRLFKLKRNLFLYLLLSILALALGIVYKINPYMPSISVMLEKYMK